MIYLLDTCVLIWALENSPKLPKTIKKAIQDPDHKILVSVVSYWEITIKKSLGKLIIPDNLELIVEETGFSWLLLQPTHIKRLEKLPLFHNDPFDRLLIAQAQSEQIPLLTTDTKVLQYFE